MNIGGHGGGGEEGHGGDRPWVFFMVDCFFLITEFFVLTFKFKSEESALPQRLPPGGTAAPNKTMQRDAKETLRVHVASSGGAAVYEYMGQQVSLSGLNDTLANAARAGGEKYSVKVSYEATAPWKDVLAVFNACNKVKIAECGLVPLRGDVSSPN